VPHPLLPPEQLSLSRGDKWDPTPGDETVDLISSLDRPAFDILDYLNWCRFLDRDMKGQIAPADEAEHSQSWWSR
jgi:hypothetical protein